MKLLTTSALALCMLVLVGCAEGNAPDPEDPDRIVSSRFVFERTGSEGQAVWKVVEPAEKSDLVLDELLVKNLVSQVLGVRSYRLVAAAARPERIWASKA